MPALDVPLRRAVAVFRVVALLYAVLVFTQAQDDVRRPGLGWAVLAAMGVWSLASMRLYAVARPPRSPAPVLAADLVLAVLAVLATAAVDDPARIAAGTPTLPVVWPAAAVLAWAVLLGPWRGEAAAVAVGAAGLAVRGEPAPTTLHNVVLLLLVGGIVGWAVRRARDAEARLAAEQRRAAAAGERERLARAVHDGVLQVLALVARRGREAGGEAAELARLAGEQERALRALVAAVPVGPAPAARRRRDVDLVALLGDVVGPGGPAATLAAPTGLVPLPAAVAHELADAVTAALDNAARHAPGASAWVLVEDEGDRVTVTVRDDGPGVPAGRLAQARGEGRLGVAQSIIGRVEALGGQATLTSAPGQGTEVVLRVPR